MYIGLNNKKLKIHVGAIYTVASQMNKNVTILAQYKITLKCY